MKVLVTRPKQREAETILQFESQGHEVESYPLFEIALNTQIGLRLSHLKGTESLVIISQFAVDAMINSPIHIPSTCTVYAIGQTTAEAFGRAYPGLDIVYPKIPDSEHLLRLMSGDDLTERPILICRGSAGRELIFNTLSAWGANVKYIECYTRSKRFKGFDQIIASWQKQQFDWVSIMSYEGLEHFLMLMKPYPELLRQAKYEVKGKRMKQLLRDYGLSNGRICLINP